MLTRRIIPCLDVKGGRVVKGVKFRDHRDAGDPVVLAEYYNKEGADELVFYDITASSDRRPIMVDVVRRTAERVFIPLTVGGGLRTVEDMHLMLEAGADKVSINTAAVKNPVLIRINGFKTSVSLPFHHEKDLGSRQFNVNEYVYVDREDINTGDVVRLKDLCNIRIESESNGVFIASVIETEKMPEKKIQWVPKEEVVKVRVEKPLDLLDGDIPRKDSLQIDTGLAEKSVSSLKNGEIVQFVRYGFVKKDRMEDIPVFIYTC